MVAISATRSSTVRLSVNRQAPTSSTKSDNLNRHGCEICRVHLCNFLCSQCRTGDAGITVIIAFTSISIMACRRVPRSAPDCGLRSTISVISVLPRLMGYPVEWSFQSAYRSFCCPVNWVLARYPAPFRYIRGRGRCGALPSGPHRPQFPPC